MAWYYGTYACGHEGRTNIVGPTKNRQWIADRHFEGLCEECEKIRSEKEKAEKAAVARKTAEENEYPELEGTDKQINWALTIREGIISKMADDILSGTCEEYPYSEYGASQVKKTELRKYTSDIMQWLITHTKAKFWIENRFKKYAYDYVLEYEKNIEKKEEKEMLDIIIVEPKNKKHSGVVELLVKENRISLEYQKNDIFTRLVKSLNYKWSGSRWYREITRFNGPLQDRMIEISNKLLTNGFAIEVPADLKEASINGTYEDEKTRWVDEVTTGNYKGWFSIFWRGKDDELYKKARALPGSKWSSALGRVVVPSKFYKEVEDFAETKSFEITDEALTMIEERKNVSIIADPKEHTQTEYQDKLKEQLETDAEIPADLRDD